jgi:hypothetical protein
MNYLFLLLIPIGMVFIINRFFGDFLGARFQGIVSYLTGYTAVRFLGFGEDISGVQLISTGVALALIMDFYSRIEDSKEGPSALRAEIQGVGVWMAITAVILAILN